MSRPQNFLDADNSYREQNLRFVRNDLEDDINKFFGGNGGGGAGGNGRPNSAAPPRNFKIVQPSPDFEHRKEFFMQLGLSNSEAGLLSNRSFCSKQFNLNYFRDKRHQLRKSRLRQCDADAKIVNEITVTIAELERQAILYGGGSGDNINDIRGGNFGGGFNGANHGGSNAGGNYGNSESGLGSRGNLDGKGYGFSGNVDIKEVGFQANFVNRNGNSLGRLGNTSDNKSAVIFDYKHGKDGNFDSKTSAPGIWDDNRSGRLGGVPGNISNRVDNFNNRIDILGNFNNRGEGPGNFNNRGDGQGNFSNRGDNSPLNFNNRGEGPGNLNNRGGGPGNFNNDIDSLGSFNNSRDGPGHFSNRGNDGMVNFNNRGDGPGNFNNRGDGPGNFSNRGNDGPVNTNNRGNGPNTFNISGPSSRNFNDRDDDGPMNFNNRRDGPGNFGNRDAPGNFDNRDAPGNFGNKDAHGNFGNRDDGYNGKFEQRWNSNPENCNNSGDRAPRPLLAGDRGFDRSPDVVFGGPRGFNGGNNAGPDNFDNRNMAIVNLDTFNEIPFKRSDNRECFEGGSSSFNNQFEESFKRRVPTPPRNINWEDRKRPFPGDINDGPPSSIYRTNQIIDNPGTNDFPLQFKNEDFNRRRSPQPNINRKDFDQFGGGNNNQGNLIKQEVPITRRGNIPPSNNRVQTFERDNVVDVKIKQNKPVGGVIYATNVNKNKTAGGNNRKSTDVAKRNTSQRTNVGRSNGGNASNVVKRNNQNQSNETNMNSNRRGISQNTNKPNSSQNIGGGSRNPSNNIPSLMAINSFGFGNIGANNDNFNTVEPMNDGGFQSNPGGFCVKSFKVNTNEKYFVNVCQTDEIPAPEDLTEEQLSEILNSETPSNYRIPMSISEPRTTKDKSNNTVEVCDIAVNPKFLVKCKKSTLFKDFFLALIAEALSEKYNVQLSIEKTIILAARKFIGSLVSHRVRNNEVLKVLQSYQSPTEEDKLKLGKLEEQSGTSGVRQQLVREIDAKELSSLRKLNEQKELDINNCTATQEPLYKLRASVKDEKVDEIQVEFYLPKCVTAHEIDLDIGEDRILMESMKYGYIFDKFVNYRLNQNRAQALFDKTNKMLQVRIPVLTAE